jgi:hypothetical protein
MGKLKVNRAKRSRLPPMIGHKETSQNSSTKFQRKDRIASRESITKKLDYHVEQGNISATKAAYLKHRLLSGDLVHSKLIDLLFKP